MQQGLVSKTIFKKIFLKKRKIDIHYHWGETGEHTSWKKPERESPKTCYMRHPEDTQKSYVYRKRKFSAGFQGLGEKPVEG